MALNGKRILLWTTISFVALIAIVVTIGMLMPVRYEGETVVEFDREVQAVWDALQDVEAHPMTGKMMKSIGALPAEDGKPTWTEDMGRGEVITVKTTTFEPPLRMVREMTSASINMSSRWDYTLEQDGSVCRITLSGVTDIERGTWHTPLFRVMMVLGGGVEAGLDIQLDMLAETLGTEARRSG